MEESRKRSFKVHEMWSKPKKHSHLLTDKPDNFAEKLTGGKRWSPDGKGDGPRHHGKTDEEILAGLGLGRSPSREKFTQSLREKLLEGATLGDIGTVIAAKERAPRRTGGHVYPVRKGSTRRGSPAPEIAPVREEFAEWLGEMTESLASSQKEAEDGHQGEVESTTPPYEEPSSSQQEEPSRSHNAKPPEIEESSEIMPVQVVIPPQEVVVAYAEFSSTENAIQQDSTEVGAIDSSNLDYFGEPGVTESLATEATQKMLEEEPEAPKEVPHTIEEEDCTEDPCNEPSWFKEYGIDKASRKHKYAMLKPEESDSDHGGISTKWSIETGKGHVAEEQFVDEMGKKPEGGITFGRHRIKKKCSVCTEQSTMDNESQDVELIGADISFLKLEADMFEPAGKKPTTAEADVAVATAGSSYLKTNVGKYLLEGMVQVALRKPRDPIEFLAHWLHAERDKEDRIQARKELDNQIMAIRRREEEERKEKKQAQALLEEGMKFYSEHQNALCRTSSIELIDLKEIDEYGEMMGEGRMSDVGSLSPIPSIDTPSAPLDLSEVEEEIVTKK